MLRIPDLRGIDDPKRLSHVLRRIWGGYVVWTSEAHQDLLFWRRVHFAKLSAPISHDAWSEDVTHWILNPTTGEVASDVRVFAVDTSAVASGGGEFLRDGKLWAVRNKRVVQLTDEEGEKSSTYRELLGTDRLDLAVIPHSCKKAVVGMDAMASVQCLFNGSKVKILQRIVKRIFLRQLDPNRVLFPLWMRRSEDMLQLCDEFSRLVDSHKYAMPAKTFWKANAMAIKVWGQGFQLDVCADMHNVQPGDSYTKLPFFSRWCSPYSSGVDMFAQRWNNTVNWCNPPFVLIGRIISLLRAQRATAAVVMPVGTSHWWSPMIDIRVPVVLAVMRLYASDMWSRVLDASKRRRRRPTECLAAIVFFDFSVDPPAKSFGSVTPTAEQLSRHAPVSESDESALPSHFLNLHNDAVLSHGVDKIRDGGSGNA